MNMPNIRIKVSDADYRQALRGLCAHAAREGLDNAPGGRRSRRSTPATLVETPPTMAELNADAWRRARRGQP
jgi:hypothetical protein